MEKIDNTTYQILQTLQEYYLAKQDRDQMTVEVRENLAKNESLRRKDFDQMIGCILNSLDKREEEVKDLVKNYCQEWKNSKQVLNENIKTYKKERIINNQNGHKGKEIIGNLKEFQGKQMKITEGLRALLAKGDNLRISDFKSMLKRFKTQ